MTFLLNIIPTILFLVGGGFMWFFWVKKRNIICLVWSIFLTIVCLTIYQGIQPSYITKNGVKSLPVLELADKKPLLLEDNLLKPEMSSEERSDHFEEKVLTYDEQIDSILKQKGENQ